MTGVCSRLLTEKFAVFDVQTGDFSVIIDKGESKNECA
jgi:hypothetical protein